MNKIIFKFALSFALLINTSIFVFFYPELIELVEYWLYPLFFVYFIIDSFSIILPIFNDSIYSSKMLKSRYIEIPNFDKNKLKSLIKKDNRMAILVFIIYFIGIAIIGFSYIQFDWFEKRFLYLLFFAINFADYFCIMLWCPFRSWFFKNSCCNTCRISNWDRIMKFSILIFIPNIYTISIVILATCIFLYWEFQHLLHPERFYRLSNQTLHCTNCDKITCGKQKKSST
jgi:hypothetical protein